MADPKNNEANAEKRTLVEDGTQFKGSLTSTCPIVVKGRIDGEVEAPSLVVSTTGAVHGRARVGEVRVPVEELKVADLGLDAAQVGAAGAGQEIIAVEEAPAREAGEIIEDDGEAFNRIVAFLDGLKVI